MKLTLDTDRPYGLVLEGGGARGAYQIGAWRALEEARIPIKGIAGTSVGALNGALVCMGELERAQAIWENISYSSVMDVEPWVMEQLHGLSGKSLPDLVKSLPDLLQAGGRILKDKGLDIEPLRRLISQAVDEDAIRGSDRELYAVTYSLTDREPVVVNIKETPPGQIGDMLMASAYLMGFKKEPLGGKYYMDGARTNNVPVDVLMDRGYRDLIVVRIYGLGVDTERRLKIPGGVRVYHINPRQDLGGILEFDARKARRNMALGYMDAKRMLYGLEGRGYYLDCGCSEAECLGRLTEGFGWYARLLGFERRGAGLRALTERGLPRLAAELKLKEGWDYRELYMAVLEELARRFGISRFQIYTPDELEGLIRSRAGGTERR